MPLFGVAYAAPNKVKTLLLWFRFPLTSSTENLTSQGLFNAGLIFKDFSRKPSIFKYSFQAYVNPC